MQERRHDELEPLSFEVTLKGCPYRDSKDIKIYMMAMDLYCELSDIDEEIRARLKYGEGLSEDERIFLEGIRKNMDVLHLIQ